MAQRLEQLLKAAGERTRLRILNLLRLGSFCVGDLQAALGIPQPSVSRHLAALRRAGLVLDLRSGTHVFYSLAPPATPEVAALFRLLNDACRQRAVFSTDQACLKRLLETRKQALVETPPIAA
jgi:ArsR family transcriptional regulator